MWLKIVKYTALYFGNFSALKNFKLLAQKVQSSRQLADAKKNQ
jgi:hypothetical protein